MVEIVQLLVLALLPILAFVILEPRYGLKPAIITALFFVGVVFVWWYLRFGELDETLLVEGGLLLLLGGLSLVLKDSRLFKFQPTIVAIVLVTYLSYFQIIGDPYLLRVMALMQQLAPAELTPILNADNFPYCMNQTSLLLIFCLAGHGALVGWAALKWSNWAWFAARLALLPIALIPNIYAITCIG